MSFETQQECWEYLLSGSSIYLRDKRNETMGTEIKFIDGVLNAYLNGEWMFCPIAFENPKLFHA